VRTKVAIIGGGPSGLFLAWLLHGAGHEVVIIERQSREHVVARVRAGVLEAGTVRLLTECGLGERMAREGFQHDGFSLSFADRQLRIDLRRLVGHPVTVYGQTELTKDLYAALDTAGVSIVHEAEGVTLHDVTSDTPFVMYEADGAVVRVDADYIAGCDGFHGVSRTAIPADVLRTYERVYPFGWLGILSETPPIDHELIYAHHERGFALCSMRNEMLSRYYVQCSLTDDVANWSDDRFWDELSTRLPSSVVPQLVTGPSIEKSIAPLRSFVSEPMSYGRLFLAGDATHIVPPTGAKGLNLAMGDVHYLFGALDAALTGTSTTGLTEYSGRALSRVWKAVRFSWWMTTLMHRFDDQGDFGVRIQEAELDYLASSEVAQRSLAENYVGLPL
jgi:p-hydroxybenzoate 3-monooxygenase